jgi:hypothetical protein
LFSLGLFVYAPPGNGGGGQHPRLPPFGGKPADLVGVSATSNKLEAAVLAPDVSRWL